MNKLLISKGSRVILAMLLTLSLILTCSIDMTTEASASTASRTYTEAGLGSVTVTGDYIAGKYLTFDAVGENQEKYASGEGEQGDIAFIPDEIALEGPYDYWSWNKRVKLGAPGKYTFRVGFAKLEYFAYGEEGEWESVDYKDLTRSISVKGKVIFNPTGGKVSNKTRYRYVKKNVGSLPKARWTNHKFKGWFTKKKSGTKIKSTTKVVFGSNISKTYYAHWANRVKVVFNANKGKVSKKYKKVWSGEKYGKLPKAKRGEDRFKGWYTKQSSGKKITKYSKVPNKKKVNLYAHWLRRVKVSFNANKGTCPKKYKKVWAGKKYGKLPKAKRGEDRFKGWYTKKYSGKKVTKYSKVPDKKNVKLYAHWLKRVKVIFNANGGTCSKTYKKVWAGKKYGELPKAKRSGYTFKGWYTKKSGGNKIKSYSRAANKHTVKLYAHWKKKASSSSRSSSGRVYITATGIRYHRTTSCSGLRNANAVWAVSLSEARGMGLTPCHICY